MYEEGKGQSKLIGRVKSLFWDHVEVKESKGHLGISIQLELERRVWG